MILESDPKPYFGVKPQTLNPNSDRLHKPYFSIKSILGFAPLDLRR